MQTLTIEEFYLLCKQQADSPLDTVVICPACKTMQSGRDFIDAGVEHDSMRKVLGFNCVGRYTGAHSARKVPDGKPCNWTLGGLLQIHTLEVVDAEGVKRPHFELASVGAAKYHRDHRAALMKKVAP